MELEQLVERIGRNAVGEHYRKRHLVAYFGPAQCGFRLLVARNDDGVFLVVMDDDLEVILALLIGGREVVKDNQVEVVDVVGKLSLLFAEL